MHRWVVLGVVLSSMAVQGKGLRCETTAGEVCDANGCREVRIFNLNHYPAEAHFQFLVTLSDPGQPAMLMEARAPVLEKNTRVDLSVWNTSFQSNPTKLPFPLPYGVAYQATNLEIPSYEACKALSGARIRDGAVVLDSRLIVKWDGGESHCTSRLVCLP